MKSIEVGNYRLNPRYVLYAGNEPLPDGNRVVEITMIDGRIFRTTLENWDNVIRQIEKEY